MRRVLAVLGAAITILGLPSTWDDLHHKWPGLIKFVFGDNYGPYLVLGGTLLILVSIFWHKIVSAKKPLGAHPGVRSARQTGGQTGLLNIAIGELPRKNEEIEPPRETTAADTGPHLGLADQVASMQRERAATDTFRVVQGDLGVREFRRAELDAMSVTQRRKLFMDDGAMELWWRGRKNDGSWAMLRLEGGEWFTHKELVAMSEEERNTVLHGFGRGVNRQWYLDRLDKPKTGDC